MIPIKDDIPTTRRPAVTVTIIVVCVAVALWQMSLSDTDEIRVVINLGFVPALLFQGVNTGDANAIVAHGLTMVTSMFLHGGFLHLAGNMLYLWVFGNNVEDGLGRGRFVTFYVLSGLAAALTQGLSDPASMVPMVGASGAVSGVLGAYLLLYPRARIVVIVPIGILFFTTRLPAAVVLGIWFTAQFLGRLAAPSQEGGVAFLAHIGGFIAGMLLLPILRPRRRRPGPWDAGGGR